jgi:hypothetical protein
VAAPFVEEVFKISGVPTHTFVEPHQFSHLRISLRSPGRGLVVEGPSGIGKSTAVARALDEIEVGRRVQPLSARKPEDVDYIQLLPEVQGFGVVVIDDFHVLPSSIQNSVADLLKTLADEEVEDSKLVIVGINRAGDSLIRHAPDLNNRIDVIKFEVEPAPQIAEVVRIGESVLNVSLDAGPQVVEAAEGSFYLAQMLCLELCIEAHVQQAQDGDRPTRVRTSYSSVKSRVMERQERRFGEAVRKFARGTKFRPSGRAPYLLLLKWLAESQRWDISLRDEIPKHPEHRGSVGQIVEKGYLAALAQSEDIAKIVHYDEAGRVLSIEDPHLIFFLRNLDWRTFAKDVGFTHIDIEHPYDFALSFAGEDRPFAERLSFHLEDLGFVVFYDLNEQHRIIARDLEAFLGPIYESGATFVIAILGQQYGERRWTRFESDQFKERFGEEKVIPIWSTAAPPTAFDRTRDIGGLTYDPAGDIDEQARALAKTCAGKHEDAMQEPQMALDVDDAVTVIDETTVL